MRHSHSALTDFLASHNISARQISDDYQRRLEEAQQQQHQEQQVGDREENVGQNEDEFDDEDEDEDLVERKKRKRKEAKAILKIKQSKEFKRRKHEMKETGSDSEDDDVLARRMMAKPQPMPGQLENCETCEKRFTVTPYSRTGPYGGLLCVKCSKAQKDEEKKVQAQQKKKKGPAKGRKRQTESDRMMGDVKPGPKSLVETCIRRVADVVHDIEEFGDMPQSLLDRLSQILSKKRVLTSRTLDLFLRPEVDRIAIYDCAKLESEDFLKIFTFMPDVQTVNLRFAGQMKDDALTYMVHKNRKVRNLQLGATNLISEDVWVLLFKELGPLLESLKLSELNDSLRDQTVAVLVANCKNLRRLKLRSCSHMTEKSIASLIALTKLEHLSLSVAPDTSADTLITLISSLGPHLKTLSLENFYEADDAVLAAIKTYCSSLTKFRFTGNNLCTDAAFASLFTKWPNPPIPFLDLSENRDVDNGNPDGNPDTERVGFGPLAFKAMMAHSGPSLQCLNLHSNRHISHEALLHVFQPSKLYPELKEVDLSFVAQVDDVILTGMWKCCPTLTKLAVFACFNARSVHIPPGIAVVGLPNAQDNIVVEGGGGIGFVVRV